jgi:hypothetical protein
MDKRIFDLWLACHMQEEIAEQLDIPRTTIEGWLSEFDDFGHLSESVKATATHATDFDPPLYNVWKRVAASAASYRTKFVLRVIPSPPR